MRPLFLVAAATSGMFVPLTASGTTLGHANKLPAWHDSSANCSLRPDSAGCQQLARCPDRTRCKRRTLSHDACSDDRPRAR